MDHPFNAMNKILFAGFISLAVSSFAIAQKTVLTGISVANNAKHIIGIKGDTIIVVKGTTYRFTVDTPEDKGLVSTKPKVDELISEIIPKNGIIHIAGKDGNKRDSGEIITGDRLIVTSQKNKTAKSYYILEQPAALNGELR